jgi:eukaryotic-like serine/threonine-protein kinase
MGATFSQDGKWVAYQSNESGETEIFIIPFPGAQMKIQASKNAGWDPRWSPDGREIYYTGKGGMLTAASLQYTKGLPEVASTRTLFKLDIPQFEVSKDGKRFLVYKVVDNQKAPTVTLVSNSSPVNWLGHTESSRQSANRAGRYLT